MTSIEEHLKKIKEHLDAINRAIDVGIEKWPANIGFNASACAVQLLELYLHKLNLISPGKVVKHNWFKRPRAGQKIEPLVERNLKIDFALKNNIYGMIYNIEEQRESLIDGKAGKEQAKQVLEIFLKLKSILLEELEKEGVRIE